MSAVTRSRSAVGSMWTLNSCGPRSPMTERWTVFLRSENGSDGPCATSGREVVSLSCSSILRPPPEQRPPLAVLMLRLFAVRLDDVVRELPERRCRIGLRARGDDRDSLVDRP